MIAKRIVTGLGALIVSTGTITTLPFAEAAGCASPIYAAAQPKADRVAPVPIANNGWRSYSLGIGSYLRRCGGYVYASHHIYLDTRNLPYGHKLWLTVSTQRGDGRWARAHDAAILQVTGHRRIEEVLLDQRRGVGDGLAVTKVQVRHTATTPGRGALIPRGSTLEGVYRPWHGPEAGPAAADSHPWIG